MIRVLRSTDHSVQIAYESISRLSGLTVDTSGLNDGSGDQPPTASANCREL